MAASPEQLTTRYRALCASDLQPAATEVPCVQCRTVLEPEAKFCVECGAAVLDTLPGGTVVADTPQLILDLAPEAHQDGGAPELGSAAAESGPAWEWQPGEVLELESLQTLAPPPIAMGPISLSHSPLPEPPPPIAEEPDLLALVAEPPSPEPSPPTRSLTSQHTRVLDAVRVEIEAELDALVAAEDAAAIQTQTQTQTSTDVDDDIPIDIEDPEDDPERDADVPPLPDCEGTVLALAPDAPRPFWPAPAPGGTVIAPPPQRPPSAPAVAVA